MFENANNLVDLASLSEVEKRRMAQQQVENKFSTAESSWAAEKEVAERADAALAGIDAQIAAEQARRTTVESQIEEARSERGRLLANGTPTEVTK